MQGTMLPRISSNTSNILYSPFGSTTPLMNVPQPHYRTLSRRYDRVIA